MSSTDDVQKEIDALEAECAILEEKAGITALMVRASEGRFIPLGAMGDECTPDEYFADEFDFFRGKMRDAYFSVEDKELRCKLIETRRKIEKKEALKRKIYISDSLKELAKAQKKAGTPPWWLAAAIGVGAVLIGYKWYDLIGALAGLVAGFFLGQGAIQSAKTESAQELANAKNEHDETVKSMKEQEDYPDPFNGSEERSGERDREMDQESAYFNVLQAQRAQET